MTKLSIYADVPYMRSSNGKLNLLLACKYMAYNFGFDE